MTPVSDTSKFLDGYCDDSDCVFQMSFLIMEFSSNFSKVVVGDIPVTCTIIKFCCIPIYIGRGLFSCYEVTLEKRDRQREKPFSKNKYQHFCSFRWIRNYSCPFWVTTSESMFIIGDSFNR